MYMYKSIHVSLTPNMDKVLIYHKPPKNHFALYPPQFIIFITLHVINLFMYLFMYLFIYLFTYLFIYVFPRSYTLGS
jgi:hypothetical protein